MAPHDPALTGSSPLRQAFLQRLAKWRQLHREHGPARSYPYARRLPELARPLGRACLRQAQYARALDLYTLGRFPEALAALPAPGETAEDGKQTRALRRRMRLLLGHEATEVKLHGREQAYLAYLQDRADAWPGQEPSAADAVSGLWLSLLRTWSQARRGLRVAPGDCHLAVARLRVLYPALGVQAEAVHAEAVFWQGPRWARVWLDHALGRVEAFGQHHLKVRLLGLKARALEAGGELAEGARFRKLARILAVRQDARLYQRLFVEPD